MPTRALDIQNSLAFAFTELARLRDSLKAFHEGQDPPRYVAQIAATICNECRDCLDYCARDIVDANAASSVKARSIFFPTTREKLNGKFFQTLKTGNPALYDHLERLIDSIESRAAFQNTLFNYATLAENEGIANEKKHNFNIKAVQRPRSAALVRAPDGTRILASPVFPVTGATPDFGAPLDASGWVSHGGATVELVTEYHLEANGWEVERFCLHVIEITWRVLEHIYVDFFGLQPQCFNPRETTKPAEQRAREAAVAAISPVGISPVLFGLRVRNVKVLTIEVEYDSETPRDPNIDRELVAALVELYWHRVKGGAHRQLTRGIEDLAQHPPPQGQPVYWELTVKAAAAVTVATRGGVTYTFDEIVFGVGVQKNRKLTNIPYGRFGTMGRHLADAFFPPVPVSGAVFRASADPS